MIDPVETVRATPAGRLHRFQVLREHRDDGVEDWVVVDLAGPTVRLASIDFEWTRQVEVDAIDGERFDPLVAGEVPVWGY